MFHVDKKAQKKGVECIGHAKNLGPTNLALHFCSSATLQLLQYVFLNAILQFERHFVFLRKYMKSPSE